MTDRQSSRRSTSSSDGWSYIAGEKGRNRVRVFARDDRGGGIWIDYRDAAGGRIRQPLGHADRDRAKLEADDVAAKFGRTQTAPAAAFNLKTLIDKYERDVTPHKSPTARSHDRRTLPLFVRAFGGGRRPATLSKSDLDSYIRRRRCGELAATGREGIAVRARVLEQDCGLLNAMLNWATRAGDDAGGTLLERNPLAGLKIPREKNPTRAVVTREQCAAGLAVATAISGSLALFVAMAWYTGHRSQSIRLLAWSDIDQAGDRIHWRGENDKIGNDHWTPIHDELAPMLAQARAIAEFTGERWVFPSPRDSRRPLSAHAVVNLWQRLAPKAGIPTGERYGWQFVPAGFCEQPPGRCPQGSPRTRRVDHRADRGLGLSTARPEGSAPGPGAAQRAGRAGKRTGTTDTRNGHHARVMA